MTVKAADKRSAVKIVDLRCRIFGGMESLNEN